MAKKFKNTLIKNSKHQRPMLAVLTRYGLGKPDQYQRGRWISEEDLPRIKASMLADPTCIDYTSRGHLFVDGTNIHNQVDFAEFEELFK